jgi:murein DD-endopeptidase MepM/ murein hydrolase activator NlpD
VSGDPAVANASGWNCRTHVEYEGAPAVDWYVPQGTPVYATHDGTATLFFNTHANAFDFYGLPREPYLGNPDRSRAPVTPFPGPGGGMGLYVSVANDGFRTDYGHLTLATIAEVVPAGAFVAPYGEDYAYAATFAVPRHFSVADVIARWPVRRGDLIGFTGDSGYSEAPHLHYQVTRLSTGAKLCPTAEAGFDDGGWLERPAD